MNSKECKYLWVNKDFDNWVKEQKQKANKKGFSISTAGVTNKLLNEVILPKQIDINFPIMITKRRKKKNVI